MSCDPVWIPVSPVCAMRPGSFRTDRVDEMSLSDSTSKSMRVRRDVWSVG